MNALVGGLSAGASKAAGLYVPLLKDASVEGIGDLLANTAKQAAIGAVVGGSVSAAFGGSFGRGAQYGAFTSAIAYNANQLGGLLVDKVESVILLTIAATMVYIVGKGVQETFRAVQNSLCVHFADGDSKEQPKTTDGQDSNSEDSQEGDWEHPWYGKLKAETHQVDLRHEGAKMGIGGRNPLDPKPKGFWQKIIYGAAQMARLFKGWSK